MLESEKWQRTAPSEIDSIWGFERRLGRPYFGHLFLLGAHKLQTLLSLSGFSVERRLPTKVGRSSLGLAVVAYPFIALSSLLSWIVYRRHERFADDERQEVLLQRLKMNLSPKTLPCKHIFWVVRKDRSHDENVEHLKSLALQAPEACQPPPS